MQVASICFSRTLRAVDTRWNCSWVARTKLTLFALSSPWDIERKRYPQYDHCAVLVAEDITSRFLNVISLFNGALPLIAIQMQALLVAGKLTLVFTKVMDELTRGAVDEDEEAEAFPADRSYWEERASKATLTIADHVLEIAKHFDPKLELKYNKNYVGLGRDGAALTSCFFDRRGQLLTSSSYCRRPATLTPRSSRPNSTRLSIARAGAGTGCASRLMI